MKLTVLGSGGWIPTARNETACYMIEAKEELILLDAGTGLSNLGHYREVLQQYETVHIVLTHYHLDHIIGLSFLPVFFPHHQVRIHGPGNPAYPKGVRQLLGDFFSEPYSSSSVDELTDSMFFSDYNDGVFAIGSVKLEAFRQHHAHISYGLKVDEDLYYATDTIVLPETFERASNVKLLLHECWDLGTSEDSFHSSLDGILEALPENTSYQTGLIHRNPRWNQEDITAARVRFGKRQIDFVEDHQVFEL